ncbi:DUF4270 family protein [Niabella terrae]
MLVSSCQKTNVYFSDNTIIEDPNITIWDNYTVSLSTFKLDSFQSNGDSVWVLGHHADPELGSINAFSFCEIARPENHPFGNDQIRFDSAALLLVPSGVYYGDTTRPFRIQVFALSQTIGSDTLGTATFYNTQSTNYLPEPIGETNLLVHPLKKDTVFIPLDDGFAGSLYTQMKNNTLAMTDQNNFRNYLKGICIAADSEQNNTIYQFSNSEAVPIIRIYYTEKGLYNNKGYYDLNYIPAKQYNHIAYDPVDSPMSVFADSGFSLAASNLTGYKALLSNLNPTRIKIEYPNLLNITESYPYVKVINASLEIRVDHSLNQSPYIIPSALLLYTGDQSNQLNSYIVSPLTGYPESGNLVSDPLEADGTKYSFDITSYINTLINEGRFSTQSLFLCPYNDNYFGTGSRLIVNTKAADPDVRLKLYVLGL